MTAEIFTLTPPMTPTQELGLEIERHQAEIRDWSSLIRQAIIVGDRPNRILWRECRAAAEARLERAMERREESEQQQRGTK